MGKMFGIVMIVVALWAALEIYNEGTANAFGGLLSRTGMVEQTTPPAGSTRLGERAGVKVGAAHDAADERRSRMLGE